MTLALLLCCTDDLDIAPLFDADIVENIAAEAAKESAVEIELPVTAVNEDAAEMAAAAAAETVEVAAAAAAVETVEAAAAETAAAETVEAAAETAAAAAAAETVEAAAETAAAAVAAAETVQTAVIVAGIEIGHVHCFLLSNPALL